MSTALRDDWRALEAERDAYSHMRPSPSKFRASMDLIGHGWAFLVNHWHELNALVQDQPE